MLQISFIASRSRKGFGLLLLAFLACLQAIGRPVPQLGDPPLPPTDLSGLPGAASPMDVTGGFSINVGSREQVRSFFNGVYVASDLVPLNSTAVVSNCVPGANNPAYYDAVLTRINWYRAMAGVPASETFGLTDCVHDQAAALIMSANDQLSHYPTASWSCYTPNGANAASNSNLALTFAGPDAINSFIWDFGANNYPCGHRRWILYPQTKIMGTGDVPDQGGLSRANATWVFDANYGGPRPPTRDGFVSWPPPGFTPYQVVFPRWSFAYPSADFSHATVSMTSNGAPVSVTLETLSANSYGENTLVWDPMGLDPSDYFTTWPFSGADTVYTVAISNVAGASSNYYKYSVTVFDSSKPGADYFPPIITGSNAITVGKTNAYSFTPVTNATSYQWALSSLPTFDFFDGAENGLSNFTTNVSPNYDVISSDVAASGLEAFHLATPTYVNQTLALNHTLLPGANTILTFASLLGLATTGQVAAVQISTNVGRTWAPLFSQSGDGTWGQSTFTTNTISLAAMAGLPTLVQFTYSFSQGSSVFTNVDIDSYGYYAGWFIDNIAVTNCLEMINPVTNSLAGTNFTLSVSNAGSFGLEARALIYTQYPLDWGPLKIVSASYPPPLVISLAPPALSRSNVALNFTLPSGASPTFHLLSSSAITGPWASNSSAVLTTNTPGLSYRFTLSTNASPQFYRIAAP